MARPFTQACQARCHAGGRRPPVVVTGRLLCPPCRDRVEADLVDLSELYELGTFSMELHDNTSCQQGLGLSHPVVAIQSHVLGGLAYWCGVVAGERGVTAPDDPSIRRLTSFLAIHLDWLTGHPSAAEFASALSALASAVRGTLSRNEK